MLPAAPVWVGDGLEDSVPVVVSAVVWVSDAVVELTATEELVVASGSTVVVAVAWTTVLVIVVVAVEVTVSASAIWGASRTRAVAKVVVKRILTLCFEELL